MIGRLVNEFLIHNSKNARYIWGDILPQLLDCDFNLVNLETALTHSEKRVPKVFNFKADPHQVQSLVEGNISVVNLANNHILDFSHEGLKETLETLRRAKLLYVGAGSQKEAEASVILEQGGIRVGVIGCTDNEPGWKTKGDKEGTFYVEVGDIQPLEHVVKELRSKADLLVLSIHWGPNMRERPPESFKQFAHRLIDIGVDIIHGHSAHIFQGIEIYKKKLIMYDTGDFIDDYAVDPRLRNDQSFYFVLDVSNQGIEKLSLFPVVISNFQVNRAFGKQCEEILKRMESLSLELGTVLEWRDEYLFWSKDKKSSPKG